MAKAASAAATPADNPHAGIKGIKRRCDDAYLAAANWRSQTDELYRYVLPLRKPANDQAKGEPRGEHAFDLTAPKASFRFAGRMERDVTPIFQQFFELKLGPAAIATIEKFVPGAENRDDAIKGANEELEKISALVMGILESSRFQLAAAEMYLDLFGGQGAMLMLEDEDEILNFTAVPVAEIALKEDGRGRVSAVYWKKEFEACDIEYGWPGTTLHETLKQICTSHPDQKVVIIQACELNRKTRRWDFTVFRENAAADEGPIYELKDMVTSPWLTPRFYKVPGEAMGRGPGMMALPTIKTLNKVTELTLKAAAFAILGLWMYRDDRVFNPKTAVMAPGQFWAVSTTGGPLGRGIEKLDVPGRFDISNIILSDLREMVKQATFDDALPPDSGAVRSATEIVERLKRLYSDISGAYARLVLELVVPLVQRCIDVAYRRNLIDKTLQVDQLLYQLKITSPIARTQQAQDVSALTDWLQILLSTVGLEGTALTAKLEDIGAEIGRKLGVPDRLIRAAGERKGIMQMVAQIIANAQMAAAQQQTAPQGVAPSRTPALAQAAAA